MKNPLVTIIVVNWNGKKHLIDCLKSLEKVTYKNKEIIVVDNGSHDGSAEYVKEHFSQYRLLANKDDLGFCIANNQGAKIAKGEYILLLNNDTVVTPQFLEPLVEKMQENKKIGVVQPKIIFKITKKLQSGCAYFTSTGFLYYFGYGKDPQLPQYNESRLLYSANGACMMIRKKVIDAIGLFDEDFFSYFEETDFCHRTLLAGYEVWYEPKGVIYHIGGVDNKKEKPSLIQFNAFRNRIYSYAKNLESKNFFQILFFNFIICMLYSVINVIKGKPYVFISIFKAFWWNFKNRKRIMQKRSKIQKHMRKISDNELFSTALKNPRLSYYYYLIPGLDFYRD